MTRKATKSGEQIATGKRDAKLKRDRSPSGEVTRPKRHKTTERVAGTANPAMSTLQHVKKYLAEASEQELDRLSDFLLNRKKPDAGTRPTEDRKAEGGTRDKRATGPDEPWRREISSGTRASTGSPEVVRRITARGLAEAHAELYPGEPVTHRKKKQRLDERETPSRTSRRTA